MNGNSANVVPTPFLVPEHQAVLDSTNRYLVDLAGSGLPDGSEVPEGYAILAERQTDGRGRLGRRWEAPAGSSVLCSILFRPDLDGEHLHLVAWAVALGAVQACKEVAGVDLSLKWPNDLVAGADERKVAGVLSEVLPAGALRGVVVGIGINVNWPRGWPPADSTDPDLLSIASRATSLNRVVGREIDRGDLVGRMLRVTGSWNERIGDHGGRFALASEYRRRSATIGREVRVELADETVGGRALDVDDAGCLLVSTDACIRTIAAGDVVHLR